MDAELTRMRSSIRLLLTLNALWCLVATIDFSTTQAGHWYSPYVLALSIIALGSTVLRLALRID